MLYNVNVCFFNYEIINMDKVERIYSKKKERFIVFEYLVD